MESIRLRNETRKTTLAPELLHKRVRFLSTTHECMDERFTKRERRILENAIEIQQKEAIQTNNINGGT